MLTLLCHLDSYDQGNGVRDKPTKRFFVIYKGKKIDFGSDSRETFFDISDKQKRKNWYARHSANAVVKKK